MAEQAPDSPVHRLIAVAERFDDLADVAELMGDGDGADRWRRSARARRREALALLDE